MTRDRDADDAAQRERALGAWELWIGESPRDAVRFERVRRILRFSRADRAWLRARLPGVVRRGGREDLAPLCERLCEEGLRAELRRRTAGGNPPPPGGRGDDAHGTGGGRSPAPEEETT